MRFSAGRKSTPEGVVREYWFSHFGWHPGNARSAWFFESKKRPHGPGWAPGLARGAKMNLGKPKFWKKHSKEWRESKDPPKYEIEKFREKPKGMTDIPPRAGKGGCFWNTWVWESALSVSLFSIPLKYEKWSTRTQTHIWKNAIEINRNWSLWPRARKCKLSRVIDAR